MEWAVTFLNLLLTLLLAGLGAFIATKMSSLAKRTDIDKVERMIRAVESEFAITTSGRLYLIEQQRVSIVELYSLFNVWFITITRLNPAYKIVHQDEEDYVVQLGSGQNQVELALGKFELFIEDEHLLKLSWDLLIAMSRLSRSRLNEFDSLKVYYHRALVDANMPREERDKVIMNEAMDSLRKTFQEAQGTVIPLMTAFRKRGRVLMREFGDSKVDASL